MPVLKQVIDFLDGLLAPQDFSDFALNGLQVEAGHGDITHVACAVDAGLSIFEKAVAAKAQLLLVHHGLFWGESAPITGVLAKKLKVLLEGGCSLYSSHLPLDAHLEVGNAARFAAYLGLKEIEPFYPYRGKNIGIRAKVSSPITIEAICEKCAALPGAINPTILRFGKSEIRTIGIATGSGAFAIPYTAAAGVDLLISGEPKHESYHSAKELGVNALFVGHYATETFGVRALAETLEREFRLKATFIDEGSGI